MFIDSTQCLPLYRYTADGERVSNITQWGLRQFRDHYGDDAITDEDIFAYVYAMLHDPAYRQRYEIDLRREFPRVYFQDDFALVGRPGPHPPRPPHQLRVHRTLPPETLRFPIHSPSFIIRSS